MPAILIRHSILFLNYISRDFDNTKVLLYKLFIRYPVGSKVEGKWGHAPRA